MWGAVEEPALWGLMVAAAWRKRPNSVSAMTVGRHCGRRGGFRTDVFPIGLGRYFDEARGAAAIGISSGCRPASVGAGVRRVPMAMKA